MVQLEASFQGEPSLPCRNPSKDGLHLIGFTKVLDEECEIKKLVPVLDTTYNTSLRLTPEAMKANLINLINTGKFYFRHNLSPSCCSLNPIPLGLIYICKKLLHSHNERY